MNGPVSLRSRLGRALAAARSRHGRAAQGRTELAGNVVTCKVSRDDEAESGADGAYRQEAVAAVVKETRQQVSSFTETEGPDGEMTEVFTLEESSGRGRPGRFRGRD